MAIEKILIVDDELLMRTFLTETLRRKNLDVTAVENGKKAVAALKENTYDLVFTDMKLPDMTGLDVLRKVKELSPNTITVVITAFGSIENAVEAMRLGAFNYLIKPFTPDTIEAVIAKGEEHLSLLEENQYLRQQVQANSPGTKELIAVSPSMKAILADAIRVAKSNASVFITGESGTGKEVIAQVIHHNSLRATKPFIKVNCAAIPDTLVESEFFGHEKGAFTGANARRCGRFELANGGTLLLDEVTEVPLILQAKLLRAIQEQEFERVGGTKPIKVDARLISTSNREIKTAISSKVLREDLFYRLNVIPLHLPPLRDRKEDILPLAEFFVARISKENHKPLKAFTQGAKDKLVRYSWPGNVRELANIIERAVVLDASGQIAEDHLYLDGIASTSSTVTSQINETTAYPNRTLQELEKRLIIETLREQKNDRASAAKKLGITLRTLRSKLTEYNLSSE